MTRTPGPFRLVALALAALALAAGALLLAPERASAQVPPTEEQAQAIERQLLCPICTNERLDVCSIAICNDMKRIIRERLAAGSSPDDIMLFFEGRYGQKVRADLKAEGFNLWLYGWIGASVLAVAAAGSWYLLSLQRRTRPAVEGASMHQPPSGDGNETPDDAWLDEQINSGEDRES